VILDTPRPNRKKGNSGNDFEGKTDASPPHFIAKPSNTKAGKKLAPDSMLPDTPNEDVEMCMDPHIATGASSSGSQKKHTSNAQNHRSPQVDSDEEGEDIDSTGKISMTVQNDPLRKSSTETLPNIDENKESPLLNKKPPLDLRTDNRFNFADVEATPQPVFNYDGLLFGKEFVSPRYTPYITSKDAFGKAGNFSKEAFVPRYSSSGYYATAAHVSRSKRKLRGGTR
jgi:hypothetical protein